MISGVAAAIGHVALRARLHGRLPPMGNHRRHRWMVLGKPVRRREIVLDLRLSVTPATARQGLWRRSIKWPRRRVGRIGPFRCRACRLRPSANRNNTRDRENACKDELHYYPPDAGQNAKLLYSRTAVEPATVAASSLSEGSKVKGQGRRGRDFSLSSPGLPGDPRLSWPCRGTQTRMAGAEASGSDAVLRTAMPGHDEQRYPLQDFLPFKTLPPSCSRRTATRRRVLRLEACNALKAARRRPRLRRVLSPRASSTTALPAPADRVVRDQHDIGDVVARDRKHQFTDASRRQLSAAMPPAGASTGWPALNAAWRVGAASGSTATMRMLPSIPRCDAADQSAAADRNQQRVDLGRVLLQLQPHRALAEQRLRWS